MIVIYFQDDIGNPFHLDNGNAFHLPVTLGSISDSSIHDLSSFNDGRVSCGLVFGIYLLFVTGKIHSLDNLPLL